MKIHALFAQRKESYEGEYAPELLEAIDEYSFEENPEYLRIVMESKNRTQDFVALKEILIDLGAGSTTKIREILNDPVVIKGEIKEKQ